MRRTAEDIARTYDARAPDVLRYLARRVPDPEVAVDLLAETFAIAIEKHRSFRGRTDEELVGWIFAIARSQLSASWRRGRHERAATARLGIDRLPRQHADALRLRIIDELPYPEVAKAIGTTEQNARARVSRALAALRATAVIEELQEQPRHA